MSKKKGKPLKIRSPAKINLFLHIIGKRPDGYHELVTLMCPVNLYDTLTLDFSGRELSVTCDDARVPQDESNLAYRAAAAFWDRVGQDVRREMGGVRIVIEKRIPVGAGLGGGSSNAASVLLGLNRHFGNAIPLPDLFAAGLSIGADVPFFIYGKPAVATGVGEILEAYDGLTPFFLILIFPGFSVSTAEIFQELDLGLTKPERKTKGIPFTKGEFDPRHHLYNDLERVTAKRHEQVPHMKEALMIQGAIGALMTGSGPTVFGLFDTRDRALKAKNTLTDRPGWNFFLAEMIV